LPEKLQYKIRYNNYGNRVEFDKMIKVAERWSALYPYDIEPYMNLINHHLLGLRLTEAKKIYKKAISKGHKTLLKQLANLQIEGEEYDDALVSLEEYKKVFPHKAESLLEVGDIYIRQGKIKEATEFFDDILVSDPSNITAALKTSDACGRSGNYAEEINILNDALELAKTPLDSARLFNGFKTNYLRSGDEDKFMRIIKSQNELNKSNYPPLQLIYSDIITNIIHYRNFDNIEHVEGLYERAIAMVDSSQKSIYECVRDFNIGFITWNKELVDSSLNECGEILKSSMGEGAEHQINGISAGLNGDYNKAIESFNLFSKESGINSIIIWNMVIDYYVKAERYDEGIELLDKVLLTNPSDPVAQYYRAKCGFKLNQIDEAKSYLTKALDTWEGASPNYRFYKEATELAKEVSL